ncbi:hypothetical protein [Gemmobacter serpentinus]|uniref:hypothetical protein n=1 Tax=Gemmobacter serpentinus TaxID=2652247 RepID=UPI00186585D1|nr:hypothetical protein [Gemmobacter serpentinus]
MTKAKARPRDRSSFLLVHLNPKARQRPPLHRQNGIIEGERQPIDEINEELDILG